MNKIVYLVAGVMIGAVIGCKSSEKELEETKSLLNSRTDMLEKSLSNGEELIKLCNEFRDLATKKVAKRKKADTEVSAD